MSHASCVLSLHINARSSRTFASRARKQVLRSVCSGGEDEARRSGGRLPQPGMPHAWLRQAYLRRVLLVLRTPDSVKYFSSLLLGA